MKLTDLLNENYGGPGKLILPKNHRAGLKVPKGGSCCANCKWWDSDKEVCSNEYYIKWAKTDTIPYASNEYCTDFWEPIPAKPKPSVDTRESMS